MSTKKPVELRRGGARPGAGRKPVASPKKSIAFRLNDETREHLLSLSESSGHSQARIIEYLVRKTKKLPNDIE